MRTVRVRRRQAPPASAKGTLVTLPRNEVAGRKGPTLYVDEATKTPLCVYVPAGAPAPLCRRVFPALKKVATHVRVTSRAAAAGPLSGSAARRVRERPREYEQINPYTYRQRRPGAFSRANRVFSNAIGWVSDTNVTAPTLQHRAGLEAAIDLAEPVDALYSVHLPRAHSAQVRALGTMPRLAPALSTCVCNSNFRTALHRDGQMMPGSFLAFAVLGDGAWRGGELVIPEIGAAFDLRPRDVLIFDAALWHGNNAFSRQGDRVSCVFYARKP